MSYASAAGALGSGDAEERTEDSQAVRIAEFGAARPLRVRHHAKDIPSCVTDARYIPGSTVRVGIAPRVTCSIRIFEDHLTLRFQRIQGSLIRMITSLSMCHRDHVHGTVGTFDMHIATDELHVCISEQHTRQQP